jgi:hypothetical protein
MNSLPVQAKPLRNWVAGILLAVFVLQLASAAYSFSRRATLEFCINQGDSFQQRFGPVQLTWCYMRTLNLSPDAPGGWDSQTEFRHLGLFYRSIAKTVWIASVNMAWTLVPNLLLLVWLGRHEMRMGWRNRPRLPKVRLHVTIERRPRASPIVH